MKTLSQYCSISILGLCLALALNSCSPSGDDGAIKLKAAPTDAQLRSGRLAFTLKENNVVRRVILPGWSATLETPPGGGAQVTILKQDSSSLVIGLPQNNTNIPEDMLFIWYPAKFTYFPPREIGYGVTPPASTANPGGKYDVFMSVYDVTNLVGGNRPPRSLQYYFYFDSIWSSGNWATNDEPAESGIYTLGDPPAKWLPL